MSPEPGPARNFKEADAKERQHALDKHLKIHYDEAHHEVAIGYGIDCGDKECKFPHTTVTIRICPSNPCAPS
jgi:hypothetical protein